MRNYCECCHLRQQLHVVVLHSNTMLDLAMRLRCWPVIRFYEQTTMMHYHFAHCVVDYLFVFFDQQQLHVLQCGLMLMCCSMMIVMVSSS